MIKKDKIAQITIWVILGVVIAASILLILLIRTKPELIRPNQGEETFDTQSYIEQCARQSVNEVTDIMIPQAGLLNLRNSIVFNNTRIEYLCDYIGYFEPCINQHPALMQEMKRDISSYATPKLDECFKNMKMEFEKKQAQVNFDDSSHPIVKIDLGKDRIFISVKKKITITKLGESNSFDELNFEVSSPLYNLASIAMEIADQEAKYCYFENVGYSIIYPRYNIGLFRMSESTKIYTIKDTKSGKSMYIAVRGCAIPHGLSTK